MRRIATTLLAAALAVTGLVATTAPAQASGHGTDVVFWEGK